MTEISNVIPAADLTLKDPPATTDEFVGIDKATNRPKRFLISALAAALSFVQSGTGAVARTVQDKQRERISVEDYGAVGDGLSHPLSERYATLSAAQVVYPHAVALTDEIDWAAFVAAQTYAASIGGAEIWLTKSRYKLNRQITVTQHHIKFRGRGLWINHDVGSNFPATWIDWTGAAGGTMFLFAPTTGASAQRGTGGGLVDVGIYGNNVADNGLVVKSWTNGEFRVYGANFNRTIVECGVVTPLGEARDCQFNDFWIYGRQITSPVATSTLIIGGDDNGTSIANTSFNRFHEISSNYKDGVALDLYDSDSNYFNLVRLNSGGGTGKGMVWRGGTAVAGANPHSARGNFFQMISVGAGGFEAKGTAEYAEASSGTIAWYDKGNGAPDPTVGTGAIVAWSDGFVSSFPGAYRMTLADNRANVQAQRALVTNETVRIHNAANNHVRITDGTNEWGINMSSGNLRIQRVSGTGLVDATGLEVQAARARFKSAVVAAAAGEVMFGNGTATTVGATGSASSLPANPVGYLVINVGGTNMKVPYYNT